MNFNETLEHFRSNFNKDGNGQRISFLITGGGYSTLNFRLGCGSSRFLEGCWDPYSQEQLISFLSQNGENVDATNFHSVEEESIISYANALKNIVLRSNPKGDKLPLLVVVSAALTTNRYRRSDNRAFIMIVRDIDKSTGKIIEMDIWNVKISKISEPLYNKCLKQNPKFIDTLRKMEDEKISQITLSLIMKDSSLLPVLSGDESLTLCKTISPNNQYRNMLSDMFTR